MALLQVAVPDSNYLFMILIGVVAFFLTAFYKSFGKMQEDVTDIKRNQAVNSEKIASMEHDISRLKNKVYE